MRFTEVQFALFKSGIRFVHLAPDQQRAEAAAADFRAAVTSELSSEYRYSRSDAKFMVCTMCGGSTDHVPVMFVEDPDECEPRALKEARYIPHRDPQGLGPMVVT